MADEPKKLALLRILDILREESDADHPLTQADIANRLERDYGIVLERKAVARNLSLLREAGVEVDDTLRGGVYLHSRDFEDTELRMLIDGVLSSKYITARHSKDLIERLCAQSNKYFKSHVKNIFSVNDWSKTENQELFYNIEVIDQAIEQGVMISYNYNKYGADKKLHKSSYQRVSPYQMILHNQRYYLMAYNSYFENMVFHRLDHMTGIKLRPEHPAVQIRTIKGYERGIDYKELASSMPYLFTDKPERITFVADNSIIDQIIEWFGKDVRMLKKDDAHVEVSLNASPTAMEYWALQFIDYVEVTAPEELRTRIRKTLEAALGKYR